MSSFRIRQWYAVQAASYFARFGLGEHFWQPKSYVFHICTEQKLREKLDYIHNNPVKAGLVDRADQWRWSSARWYLRGQSIGVPIQWVEYG
jgi:putative transposase